MGSYGKDPVPSLVQANGLAPTKDVDNTVYEVDVAVAARKQSLADVWSWNASVPEVVQSCVHDLFVDRVLQQPDAPAVCAWDGGLTYGELDRLSTALACHLVTSLGVGHGTIVPLCFEKTIWTPVAMLGVMKAGAASVAMDASYPEARLRTIVQQAHMHSNRRLLLSSRGNEELSHRLLGAASTADLFIVSEAIIRHLPDISSCNLTATVHPDDMLYVVFTSGSTGTPKGAVISHSNFTSAIEHQRDSLGINRHSRVFDFVSYGFDVTWSNILHTLTAGGCLCIPSESDRQGDISGAIRALRATYAHLTPTVGRLINPTDVPELHTIMFIGEKLARSDLERWNGFSTAYNTYGPAECTVTNTIAVKKPGEPQELGDPGIGKGCGTVTWVVRLDGDDLSAVGDIGELWLEGPLVGQGYLGDPKKSATAFVQDPPWLLRGGPGVAGRRGRLYRTGDLVRYNSDGSLLFIGRKDDQVKIRGQRVELGDIEHHLKRRLLSYPDVGIVAEVIQPAGSDVPLLAAFLTIAKSAHVDKSARHGTNITTETAMLEYLLPLINDGIAQDLPVHMIPGAYIPIDEIPMTGTGKTDRRRLRAIAGAMTLEQLVESNRSRGPRQKPATEAERHLQRLWACVLGIDGDMICADDDFLRIGGDSVAAIRLAAMARDQGFSLSVADVFCHPRLKDLSRYLVANTAAAEPVVPFSLLAHIAEPKIRAQAAARCQIPEDHIQDAFPCTPLQEGLLAMTAKRSGGDYVAREVFQLRVGVDLALFQVAWEKVTSGSDILRTRLVDLPDHGLCQVVTTDSPLLAIGDNLAGYLAEDEQREMWLGSALTRAALITDRQCGTSYFIWTIHHALYDDWSIPLLLGNLTRAYNGQTALATIPFQVFVKHHSASALDQQAMANYWESQLMGCEAPPFPPLPTVGYQPRADKSVHRVVAGLQWPQRGITPSNILRAAWAIILGGYVESHEAEVVMGAVVSGRQVSIPGIDRIAGPTIATVPIRVKLDYNASVMTLLSQIQSQSVDMLPYEQFGLSRIRRLGVVEAQACDFQSLLVVQPKEAGRTPRSGLFTGKTDNVTASYHQFNTFALVVICQLQDDGVSFTINYDGKVLESGQGERMLQQLEGIIRQLCHPAIDKETLLGSITTMIDQDLKDIWTWNASVPKAVQSCVQDLFAKCVLQQPDAIAVCAWDGELTYRELDTLSTNLAFHLSSFEIGPGAIVPLCFEKSMWTPVAMLGVMKTGAASVAMDSSHPEARLRTIVDQAHTHSNRQVLLSSIQNQNLCYRLMATEFDTAESDRSAVIVPEAVAHRMPNPSKWQLPPVHPDDTLYIVFTSGSTGTPKGVIINHANFSSAIRYRAARCGLGGPSSRVFDFASYTFDAAWFNILHTVTSGGCVCIPSENDRKNNIVSAIRALKPTYAVMTPTVARLIDPKDVPTLKGIMFAGEKVRKSDVVPWKDIDGVYNGYGPAECTIESTVGSIVLDTEDKKEPGIGKGYGVVTWVVHLNGTKLATMGEIGELWLEGPLVGQGYLGDPDKTAAAFVKDPSWLLQGGPGIAGRHGRLYRTGDLVRYNPDGSLRFVGRKDDQIKIRGQRVELGDVETHIKGALTVIPEVPVLGVEVIAQVIVPRDSLHPVLVAFVSLQNCLEENQSSLKSTVTRLTKDINKHLATQLPQYMVPSVYIPIAVVPTTISGKVDRRRLQQIVQDMDLAELTNYKSSPRKAPTNKLEDGLVKVWASVLNIPCNDISIDVPFTSLGGDSVSAMQVVSRSRSEGIQIGVSDILRHHTIENISLHCRPLQVDTVNSSAANDLSLLALTTDGRADLVAQLDSMGIYMDDVVDIFPCTPLQEGILLSIAKRSATYRIVQVWVCEYAGSNKPINAERLESAWKRAITRHSMFSTIFLELAAREKNFLQAQLRHPPIRVQLISSGCHSPQDTLRDMEGSTFPYKEPQYAVTICQSSNGEEVACRLDINHALIDATSLPLLLTDVAKAYEEDGALLKATEFRQVIQEIFRLPSTDKYNYWNNYLSGVEPCNLPVVIGYETAHVGTHGTAHGTAHGEAHGKEDHKSTYGFITICSRVTEQLAPLCQARNITRSTVLQVAWAMVLSQLTNNKKDVCFGYLASGRDIAVEGVEEIVGPLINLLISRVDMSVLPSVVLAVTEQYLINNFEHQHVSLAKLQRELCSHGQYLFNTSVTVRQMLHAGKSGSQGLHFSSMYEKDPHEFDVGIMAELNGPSTEVTIGYRIERIARSLASEAAKTLEQAIVFLTQSAIDCHKESLHDAFFHYRVGVSQSQAESLWRHRLQDLKAIQYPALPRPGYIPQPNCVQEYIIGDVPIADTAHAAQPTAILWAAWALMMAIYTNTDDVVFGSTVTQGCNSEPTTPMPVRVKINYDMKADELLKEVAATYEEMSQFRHISLHWIRDLGEDGKQACAFQTELHICTGTQSAKATTETSTTSDNTAVQSICQVYDDKVSVAVRFDASAVEPASIRRMVLQFGRLLKQLCRSCPVKIRDIQSISDEDLADIWSWNSTVPTVAQSCVHDLFADRVVQQPDAPAVCAWDGELTYQELDTLSTNLASHLASRGIGPGSIVPLCFEKSMWMPVAMLGVMKVGAASVAMDVSHPEARLRKIVQQVYAYSSNRARVLLSSERNKDLSGRLVGIGMTTKDVIIPEATVRHLPDAQHRLTKVHHDAIIYIVFTSGSTGTPKGALISHSNFSTAIKYQHVFLGIDTSSRIYDFASYSFDVAWANILHTLTAGGCLCIPSDSDRQGDIMGSIRRLGATSALLTPTVLSLIRQQDVPDMKSIIATGEKLTRPQLLSLSGFDRIYNAYGPAECSVLSTVAVLKNVMTEDSNSIGKGHGIVTWVVRVDGVGLAAVGEAGELWIEGPLVGQGYLGDPEKTAAAFVQDPPWLLRGGPGIAGRRGRLYRTGDLVRYNSDGSLLFIGRKDDQVKIRGQRVELGDIETQIKNALATVPVQVIAEVITPRGSNHPVLVAFISLESCSESSQTLQAIMINLTKDLDKQLATQLPQYMVPSAYIPIATIPTTITAKVDRKRLREIGQEMELAKITNYKSSKKAPSNKLEEELAKVWADVLNIPYDDISTDVSFVSLSGDSVSAMQVVSQSRSKGFHIGVSDILRHQTIERISPYCRLLQNDTVNDIRPRLSISNGAAMPTINDFPLLTLTGDRFEGLLAQLQTLGTKMIDIIDIFPCTPLQEGILLSIAKGSATYRILHIWTCTSSNSKPIDAEMLKSAWTQAITRHSIFSLMFLEFAGEHSFLQVQLRHTPIRIRCISSGSHCPNTTLKDMENPTFSINEPQYAITICQSSNGEVACRLDINHALIDATSISLLLTDIAKAYEGRSLLPATEFRQVIKEVFRLPMGDKYKYWKRYLSGIQPCNLPISARHGKDDEISYGFITIPSRVTDQLFALCQTYNVTRSTVLQIAWALVLSQLTNNRDVCFGYLASGRDIAVQGIDEVVGPLINLLISRIDVGSSASTVLAATEQHIINNFEFQHVSLLRLQRELGLQGQQLCNTSITIRQVPHITNEREMALRFSKVLDKDYNELDIGIGAELSGPKTMVSLGYRANRVGHSLAHEAAKTLELAIMYLIQGGIDSADDSLQNAFFQYRVGLNQSQAASIWRHRLRDLQAIQYPALPQLSYRPELVAEDNYVIRDTQIADHATQPAIILWTAWALILASYTNTNDIVFGGSTATEIQDSESQMETLIPVRVKINHDLNVDELLEEVAATYEEISQFNHPSLHWIRGLGEDGERACAFQTGLQVYQAGSQQHAKATTKTPQTCENIVIQLGCELRANQIYVTVHFDHHIIESPQMHRMLIQFGSLVQQLCRPQPRKGKISDVQFFSIEDLAEVWCWNASVPVAVQSCVHDLFADRVLQQPDAPAICAWDGDLTYRELETLSNTLACHLLSLNVGRGTIVPLCFEKSMWTPVAMLGVMKTGAASVAMDSSHPEARLRTIVQQAHANSNTCLIISSKSKEELSRKLLLDRSVTTAVVVPETITHVPNAPNYQPAAVHADDILYVVFTSGSTGNPKGVVVSHGNFSSAIHHHAGESRLGPSSRVFDFASYAFDATWCNVLHTVTSGGCVCIPSDDDRKSDVPGAMRRLNVTYAVLTPTITRLIHPKDVPLLERIIFVGEKLRKSDLVRWEGFKNASNCYGPAECTIASTIATIVPGDEKEPDIGKGYGSVTWIVRPDGMALAGIGQVGELWLEGPLVSQGYLGDPEKTATAFIKDPPWLLKGGPNVPGRRGRLYRTGDLVRYHPDGSGSLQFIGRKDHQVKIRGQRVELGDVETHVKEALVAAPDVQVVAEIITPRSSVRPILVAFISLQSCPDSSQLQSTVSSLTNGLSKQLAMQLPQYMVPIAYIPITVIPTTITAKVDRRRLQQIGQDMDLADLTNYKLSSSKIAPSNKLEEGLARVWAEVLNIPYNDISTDIPFTSLGGDSVSAMQVVSRSRAKGIQVTVSDILRHHTIQEVAPFSRLLQDDAAEDLKSEAINQPWGLSPIQRLFFSNHPNGLNHFNQSFLFRFRSSVSETALRKAAQALVMRHGMLRARFRRDDKGNWEQFVVDANHDSFLFTAHHIISDSEVYDFAQTRQESLDITEGPVFGIDHFEGNEGEQSILFTAHHLVIDLVSWRIIWQDLEHLLRGGHQLSPATTSFRTWVAALQNDKDSTESNRILPFKLTSRFDLWGVAPAENLLGATNDYNVFLDRNTTSLLLGNGNKALRTEPVDIMVSVLIHSLYALFPDRPAPAVFLEGHGREPPEHSSIDLSETVGWFTTLCPIQIPLNRDSTLIDAAKHVKDVRRSILRKGLPYFVSRCQDTTSQFASHENVEFLFNYAGIYQQLENSRSIFRRTDIEIMEASPSTRRTALVEINGGVEEGRLRFSISMHRSMNDLHVLEQWAQGLNERFLSSVLALTNASAVPTKSDYPMLALSYDKLNDLIAQLDGMGISMGNIIDIFPCTPLQEGILLSIVKGSASYRIVQTWNCTDLSNLNSTVDAKRLESAWKRAISRHSIFSVIFIEVAGEQNFLQVQLGSAPIRIQQISSGPGSHCPERILKEMEDPAFPTDEPQYAISICKSSTGEVACRLDINHALIDATSLPLLLADVTRAYHEDRALPMTTEFRDVIREVLRVPSEEKYAYWTEYLSDITPCNLPVVETHGNEETETLYGSIPIPSRVTGQQLLVLCQKYNATRSTILQVAWAMVLSQFTNQKDVCFGYLASGRDIAVQGGVEEVVGPLINLLVSRIDLGSSASEVLATTKQNLINNFENQHISLAKLQRKVSSHGEQLFNTSITVRQSFKTNAKNQGLHLSSSYGRDSNEFDIGVSAELNGDSTEVNLGYHTNRVSQSLAFEIAETLTQAITYLAEVEMDCRDEYFQDESLYDAFFSYRVGFSQSQAELSWKHRLQDLQAVQYPLLPQPKYQPQPNATQEYSIKDVRLADNSIQPSVILWTAWALMVAIYTNTEDVVFGSSVVMQGYHSKAPTLMPVRVRINYDMDVHDLLKEVAKIYEEMSQFRRVSLHWIRGLGDDGKRACAFQTGLQVHEDRTQQTKAIMEATNSPSTSSSLNTNEDTAVQSTCQVRRDEVHVTVRFDDHIIEASQIRRMVAQFGGLVQRLVQQLSHNESCSVLVRDIRSISDEDLTDIWSWNALVPERVQACVHDLFIDRMLQQPDAPAICAWDGDLTYRELDRMSTILAQHLVVSFGIGPGTIIPLCFEKSMWTPVAMMGVMKTGAASVAMDSSHPEARLRTIVQQVHTQSSRQVLLCSVKNKTLSYALMGVDSDKEAVITPEVVVRHHTLVPSWQLPRVHSDNTLYVVFTSGSTGTPKGAVISHGNFSSAIKHQQIPFGFHHTSRVFEFASYAFNAVWFNILHTLTSGGCVCVPSDDDRKSNVAGAIRTLRATYALVTPTLAQLIHFKDTPALTRIMFAGEKLHRSDLTHWNGVKDACNCYGLAECTAASSVGPIAFTDTKDPSVGKGCGVVTWIVRTDATALAAIGEIGELWLEGPLVGQGYLGDPEKTAASFVHDPPWLLQGGPGIGVTGRRGRLYRTGDLMRYNSDGTLQLVGRKDHQVKIRGQRVELGEVEHHLKRLLVSYPDVGIVADVVQPSGSNVPLLAAFLAIGEPNAETNTTLASLVALIDESIAYDLPAHMVPRAYIPVKNIPMTGTGKTDRRRLRDIASAMTLEQLVDLNPSRSQGLRRKPTTESERLLQRLWASVLGVDSDSISADDNFLRIGGDSVSAMRLVAVARDQALSLSVADIFRHPHLKDLSRHLKAHVAVRAGPVTPFSLLEPNFSESNIRAQAAARCHIGEDHIEDVFPCTPLQEGLLAMTAKRSGDYVARGIFQLRADVDVARFDAAWQQVAATTSILRTRVIDLPNHGLVQVISTDTPPLIVRHDLTDYLREDEQREMRLGSALTRAAVVIHNQGNTSTSYYVWTIHHALYDAWTMPVLLDNLVRAYNGLNRHVTVPFQAFLKHISALDQEAAANFWRSQLGDCEAAPFPHLHTSGYQPRANKALHHTVTRLQWSRHSFTPSNLLRAAWAIILAGHGHSQFNTSDVVMGAVVSGRQASVPGIDRITGPTIATVPVRVKLDYNAPIASLLSQIQSQAVEMLPYEQFGLSRIRRLGVSEAQACDFQSLLVVQPKAEAQVQTVWGDLLTDKTDDFTDGFDQFNTFALMLICQPDEHGFELSVSFDTEVLEVKETERIIEQLETVMRQLCNVDIEKTLLGEITTISDRDLSDIWSWNSAVPETVQSCVHDLFTDRMLQQPDAPAICAWDGNLTYGELDKLSTALARHLASLDIGSGTIIPLCFEKSMWTSVTMLGVMKTGAASVAMDSSHPEARLRTVIQQAHRHSNKPFLVSSTANKELSHRLLGADSGSVVVPEAIMPQLLDASSFQPLAAVHPDAMLYVVFTSGSTGTPKGAIISHANFSSAIKYQRDSLGINRCSRVFDFASYAFDVAWSNLLHTLIAGGCICIPSNTDRGDITGSMRNLGATCALLTPTVARLIKPQSVPSLQNIIFTGEKLCRPALHSFSGSSQRICNAYGPAECTVTNTISVLQPGETGDPSIGKGCGTVTWVVRPNGTALAALGEIGELWLEGPLVGHGYLGEAEKTAAVFIQDPSWLLQGGRGIAGRHGRLYRTGDLVRYNPDGCLQYIGRKDNQVKIRGQRVELGEIEYHLKQYLASHPGHDIDIIAEVVQPAGGTVPLLVAFLAIGESANRGSTWTNTVLESLMALIDDHVTNDLPAHMIPGAYIPVEEIPITGTGKTDRRRLRDMASSMTLEQLGDLSPERSRSCELRRKPATETERQLQHLWASVLGVDSDSISATDNFLRIGGDSVAAMRLVAMARDQALSLSVGDVLKHPRLSSMAATIVTDDSIHTDPAPFSILKAPLELSLLQSIIRPHYSRHINILDVLPTTQFQQECIASAISTPLGQTYHFYLDFPADVGPEQLINACNSLWQHFDILRAIFIRIDEQYLQLIPQDTPLDLSVHVVQSSVEASRQWCEADSALLELGKSYVRMAIFQTPDSASRLVLRLCHAQYDGFMLHQIVRYLGATLSGSPLPLATSFARYMRYIDTQRQSSVHHWKNLLDGSNPSRLKFDGPDATSTTILESKFFVTALQSGATAATAFIATCASAISSLTHSEDITVGLLVSGRATMPDQLDVSGPCVNIIPVRVNLHGHENLDDVIRSVQKQRLTGLAHEASQLSDIVALSATWAPNDTLGFVLQFQNIDENPAFVVHGTSSRLGVHDRPAIFDHAAIWICARPVKDEWELNIKANPTLYRQDTISRLAKALKGVIEQ